MGACLQCERYWVQIPASAMKLFQKIQISLFNWGYKWTWMLTLSLRSLVPGLQWKSSWAAVEMPGLWWKSSWAALEMPGLQWKWLSEARLESGFYHGEWRQRQRKIFPIELTKGMDFGIPWWQAKFSLFLRECVLQFCFFIFAMCVQDQPTP